MFKKTAAVIIAAASIFTLSLTGCGSNTSSVIVNGKPVAVAKKLDTSNMFTDTDKEIGYDSASCTKIELSDKSVTIDKAGYYILSGTLNNGQVIINASKTDKVHIILDGVTINCDTSAAIYVKQADKVFVTLANDSVNTLSNKKDFVAIDDNKIDAVVFSKDDITFNGLGTLTVNAAYGNGIVSKNDLLFVSGTYNITSKSSGLSGEDSVRIADGSFTVKSDKDSIQAENTEDTSKGFVYIAGGTFKLTSEGDGIDAAGTLQIDNGNFDIITAGGSANSTKLKNQGMPGGSVPDKSQSTDSNQSSDLPQGALGDGQQQPQGGDAGGGQMPSFEPNSQNGTPPTLPSGDTTQNNKQDKTQANTQAASTDEDTVSTKAFKSDSDIIVSAGIFKIDSMDDSFHSNSNLEIDGGTFTISAGDDAFHANVNTAINSGTITVKTSYESIEGQKIYITGSTIDVTATDDGLNAATPTASTNASGEKGTMQNDINCLIQITGGKLTVNASGDGIDSNGALTVTAGEIFVSGSTNGADASIDYNGEAKITGGTVIAVGSSSMAENFGNTSTQGAIMVTLDSTEKADTTVTLKDSSGKELLKGSAAKSYNCVIISSPDIKKGSKYTVTAGTSTKEVEMTDIVYGSGSTQGMGGQNGTQRPDGTKGNREKNSSSQTSSTTASKA